MAIIVYQEIKPKNSKEEVVQYFKDALIYTRAFDGNIEVQVYEDDADDSIVRLISKWESREHYAKYREYRASLGGQLAKIATIPVMTFNTLKEEI